MDRVVTERRERCAKSAGPGRTSSRLVSTFFQQGGRPLLPVVVTGGHALSASLRY